MATKRTKQLNAMEEKLDHLTDLIESNEVKQLRKDSEELRQLKSLLSHVKFKIKDTRVVEDQTTGQISVVVVYELPRIVLDLDESGQPPKNDFFYSTNMLNMISLEDMANFQKVLRHAQTKIKK